MKFVLVAGEASGDSLGGSLITALTEEFPDATFSGVGGDRMEAAGCALWDRYDALAVMGFTEVVSRLPSLLKLRRRVIEQTLATNPACYIGVDAPDFNLGIERRLKAKGLTAVHYVSPSVWAWRQKRAAKIADSTDLILTLFPFEPEIFHQFGGAAEFVGHPLADEVPLEPNREAARSELSLDPSADLLAVLPGSREGELNRLGDLFVATAAKLKRSIPNLQLITPLARPKMRESLQPRIAAANLEDCWTVIDGNAQAAMIASNAVLLASGTAALEAMLCKRPMVVSYRISPLTYGIVTKLGMLNSEHFALPNVLTDEPVVPEVMQDAATPDRLAQELEKLLTDESAARIQTDAFAAAHRQLRGDGARRAAAAIAKLVRSSS